VTDGPSNLLRDFWLEGLIYRGIGQQTKKSGSVLSFNFPMLARVCSYKVLFPEISTQETSPMLLVALMH